MHNYRRSSRDQANRLRVLQPSQKSNDGKKAVAYSHIAVGEFVHCSDVKFEGYGLCILPEGADKVVLHPSNANLHLLLVIHISVNCIRLTKSISTS